MRFTQKAHSRCAPKKSLFHRLRIILDYEQVSPCGTIRHPSTLLPVLQRSWIEPITARKLRLGKARLRAHATNVYSGWDVIHLYAPL